MLALLLCIGCHDPVAGSLRTDREGLYERMANTTAATDVWWMARAAAGHNGAPGRADAQVHAWIAVSATARTDLTTSLGPTMGRAVTYLPDEVAEVIIPEEERRTLRHNAEKKLYRLEGERFPPEGVGRGDYKGQTVLLSNDRLYVSLQAR